MKNILKNRPLLGSRRGFHYFIIQVIFNDMINHRINKDKDMCLMCVEIWKERMTFGEARKALPELIATAKDEAEKEHYLELLRADEEELKELAKDAGTKD